MNYYLDWQLNLAEHHVAMAPYGGPVGKDYMHRHAHTCMGHTYVHVLSLGLCVYSCHAEGPAKAEGGEEEHSHLHTLRKTHFLHPCEFLPLDCSILQHIMH